MKHYTKVELKARAEKNAQAPDAAVVMSNDEANNEPTPKTPTPVAPLMTLSGKKPARPFGPAPTNVSLADMLTLLEKAFVNSNARSREVALANPDMLREVVGTLSETHDKHREWARELLAELDAAKSAKHAAAVERCADATKNAIDRIIDETKVTVEKDDKNDSTKSSKSTKVDKSAPAATKSKKAAPKAASNTKTHAKQNMYALIDSHVCSHDGAKLSVEKLSGKDGVKATCSKCNHEFYINRKIHTRACRTCQAEARKAKAS